MTPGANKLTRTTDEAIFAASVSLGRALRELGLSASVDSEHTFMRALAEIDMRDQMQVFWAGYAAFVHGPDDRPPYAATFERWWQGRPLDFAEVGSEHGESDARMQGSHHGGEALPQFGNEGREAVPLDGDGTRADREIPNATSGDGTSHPQRGILAAWSSEEVLSEREELEFADEELLALRHLAHSIRRQAPQRRSRRSRPAACGNHFDVRTTVRRSLATDGEAFRLAFSAPTMRPRRLLFICDVSGSMDRYSRALLASLKAAVGAARKCEAFVFATRLTRLTRSLKGSDLEDALEKARGEVPDWSGGTRIGETLSSFNATYGRRGFARGAIILIVSDGWDRGDPRVLSAEVQRMQLQSRRLVWINPRPMAIDEQPLAIGMRAAMPFVDDFVPGHDPRAVAGLATLIANLGNAKPPRTVRVPAPPQG